MADLATLKVKIDAAEAVKTTRDLGVELNKTGAAGGKAADGMNQAKRAADDSAGSFRSLGNAVRAVVFGAAARETLLMVDAAKQLEGRLKLVTNSADELAGVQLRLRQQSERTRMSYEATVQLYARTAMASEALGISQQRLMKFTELTNMAVKASGATSQESSAALIQLSQGIASGTLRGQELISVMEQIPAVARAIQQGLGITQGEFRALAAEGKITGVEVIDAVNKMETKIRKDFASAPQLVSEAFVKMKDDIMFALAEMEANTGLTSNIVKNIKRLGNIISMGIRGTVVFGEVAEDYLNLGQRGPGPATRSALQGLDRMLGLGPQGGPISNATLQRMFGAGATGTIANYLGASAAPATVASAPATKAQTKAITDPLIQALKDFFAEFAEWEAKGFSDRIEALAEQLDAEKKAMDDFNAEYERWVKKAGEDRIETLVEQQDKEKKRLEDERKKREKEGEEIATFFRENLQRAFGDVLTDFSLNGRLAVRDIFGTLRQLGGTMVGQGGAGLIQGFLKDLIPKSMGPLGSIFAGAGLLGLGSLFGGRNRAPRETYEERMARAQAQYASIDAIRQRRTDEMRQFIEGRTAGRGGVVQSVGTVLQETTASRMIGELVAIRVATTRTADAVAGSGSMAGTTVNVTVQGGMGQDVKSIGTEVANAVDRMLGTRVQALRLTSGTAVTT